MERGSVVILNWDGEGMRRRFLASVVACSQGEGGEVCVADNASSDGSLALLETAFPSVRLVKLDANYGFAEGYNRALSQLDSEYVVLLNSDVEVTPHWLEPLVEYMDEHSKVAVCQPKLLNQRNKSFFEYAGAAGGYIDKYGYPFCRGRIFDVLEEDHGQYDTVRQVFWVSGAAMFIRLKEYKEVGGLDKDFFAHMEEIDLCWRLNARSKTLVCVPQSVVFHVGGGTLGKENPRKTFLNFRNNLLMLYKNLPEKELKKVLFVRGALDWIAAFAFFLKGERESAKAVLQARREFKDLRASYEEKGSDNMSRAIVGCIASRVAYGILWKYHVCRKRCYSQLHD